MIIFATIVGCLGLVISIISILFAMLSINSIMSQNPNITVNSSPNTDNNSGEFSDDYVKGYNDGKAHFMSILDLTMFDMFRQNEILNYESHIGEITERMFKILKDDEYRDEVIQLITEYQEGDENDSNNY